MFKGLNGNKNHFIVIVTFPLNHSIYRCAAASLHYSVNINHFDVE